MGGSTWVRADRLLPSNVCVSVCVYGCPQQRPATDQAQAQHTARQHGLGSVWLSFFSTAPSQTQHQLLQDGQACMQASCGLTMMMMMHSVRYPIPPHVIWVTRSLWESTVRIKSLVQPADGQGSLRSPPCWVQLLLACALFMPACACCAAKLLLRFDCWYILDRSDPCTVVIRWQEDWGNGP